ncbi:MAG: terminase small subunit [bacterium]
MKEKKLTPKQKAFAREYVKEGNATEAAKKAGYSKTAARQIGSENLSKPYIQEEIQEKQAVLAEKAQVSAEFVINNFLEILNFNKQVEEFTQNDGENVRVKKKMIDAQAALKASELLGKHLGLFVDKLQVTGKDGKDLIPIEERKTNLARKLASFLAKETIDNKD